MAKIEILINIADSLLELHIWWCGAPTHPNHNAACKIAWEGFPDESSRY